MFNLLQIFTFPKEITVEAKNFKDKIPELIGMSKNYILWSTSLERDFYNDKKVRKSIEDAVKRNVQIKLLSTSPKNINGIKWLKELSTNSMIEFRETPTNFEHTIIVDGKHLRIEKRHEPGKIGESNKIIYNTASAKIKQVDFYKQWDKSKNPFDSE